MKFKDIKVGDTDYYLDSVRTGFHQSRGFWMPKEVVKVTKTQITLSNGKRADMREGRIIGDRYKYAKSLGDSHYGRTVVDETEDMQRFKDKLELEKQFNFVLKSMIEVKPDSHFSNEELTELNVKAHELYQLFVSKTVEEL